MKRIKIVVTDSSLKDVVGKEVNLCLYDKASFLHVLKKLDVCTKGNFLIKDFPEYRSLFHMIWNPIEKRIYKQIATSAYKDREFFDIRENPQNTLPNGLTIYLGLGLCKSEAEEVVDFKTFQKLICTQNLKLGF
jgi:hypothetical protein